MSNATILHVTQSVSRLAGGLFESVRRLSQSIRMAGDARLEVVGLRDERTAEDIGCWAPLPVRAHRVFGPRKFGYAPELAVDLSASQAHLVHLHGVWQYGSIAVRRWAQRTGRPYTISAHGMLEPWALRQSRWRKGLATWLYQGACLRGAVCLRATSLLEAQSLRSAGCRNPVALIPNGVEIPTPLPPRPAGNGRIRQALFLSRIHPKKGLLNLVQAWAAIRPGNWRLAIVGPDEGGHLAEVRACVSAHRLEGEIVFPGEAWGEAKTRLYCDSDLFVLPSFSENFGLVIAEALSSGVPVITTKATPWAELAGRNCGWWIDVGVEPLVNALREATSRTSGELQAMGRRGRQLVEQNYAWEPVGRRMVEVYEWMLGRGPRPECIID